MALDTKDKLKEVRERLAAARARRTQLARERDDVKGKMADVDFSESANDVIASPAFKEAEQIVKNLGECDDEIASLQTVEQTLVSLLGDRQNPGGPLSHGPGNPFEREERSIGWNGRVLLGESEGYRNAIELGLFNSTNRFGTVEIGQVCTRDEALAYLNPRMQAGLPTAPAGNIGTDQGAVAPDVRGIFPPALLPLTLLDIIPSGTTDSNIIQYVQVTAVPGYAAETAELAVKPQEGLSLFDATAPVRTIAGYAKMARQAMDDMAGLATLINTLLPWDVRRRLMNQMLFGDGTGQNLLGIANASGIGAPASTGVTAPNAADGLLLAATTVVLADGDPTFAVVNPVTWQNLLLAKATTNQYIVGDAADYVAGPEFTTYTRPWTGQTIWGLRVLQNRLVPAANGGPIVGDPIGATVLVREGVNIRTSDADQDDFVRNRVTVLAETRVALPIWRPSAFAKSPVG
jgi:hypothetical protein